MARDEELGEIEGEPMGLDSPKAESSEEEGAPKGGATPWERCVPLGFSLWKRHLRSALRAHASRAPLAQQNEGHVQCDNVQNATPRAQLAQACTSALLHWRYARALLPLVRARAAAMVTLSRPQALGATFDAVHVACVERVRVERRADTDNTLNRPRASFSRRPLSAAPLPARARGAAAARARRCAAAAAAALSCARRSSRRTRTSCAGWRTPS